MSNELEKKLNAVDLNLQPDQADKRWNEYLKIKRWRLLAKNKWNIDLPDSREEALIEIVKLEKIAERENLDRINNSIQVLQQIELSAELPVVLEIFKNKTGALSTTRALDKDGLNGKLSYQIIFGRPSGVVEEKRHVGYNPITGGGHDGYSGGEAIYDTYISPTTSYRNSLVDFNLTSVYPGDSIYCEVDKLVFFKFLRKQNNDRVFEFQEYDFEHARAYNSYIGRRETDYLTFLNGKNINATRPLQFKNGKTISDFKNGFENFLTDIYGFYRFNIMEK